MSDNVDERINPAVLTWNETGEVFELDFNRDSIRFAENRGFKLENVAEFPVTNIPDLFFYSFRKNHRKIARDKTDKILETWGGMPEKLLTRLILLYQQAQTSNTIQIDEDAEKNSKVTLEL